MTHEDRILSKLGSGRRLCDDCLSDISGVKPRRSVYQAYTALRNKGLITRLTESCETCRRMKITNARITQLTRQCPPTPAPVRSTPSEKATAPSLTDTARLSRRSSPVIYSSTRP